MSKDLVVDEKGNVLNVNNIELFTDSEFGELEIVEADGKFLFPATDCAVKLGYSNPWKAIGDHCRSLTKREVPHPQSNNKTIEKNYIPEGDLYRLIVYSKLPSVKKFESWVFDEVLPSIRKRGAYMTPKVARQVIDSPYFLPELAKAFIAEKEKTKRLEEKITKDEPYTKLGRAVAISDQEIPIGELAKVICQNDYEIGRIRLFQYLRENRYLISRGDEKNLPRQHVLEAGLFKVKACKFYDRGIEKVSLKSMVTPKGQLFFVNHFLGEKKES